MKTRVNILIASLLLVCSALMAQEKVVADSTGYIVKVGDMAPDFSMQLTDGKTVTLSELRGKVVRSMPQGDAFYRKGYLAETPGR